MLNELSVLSRSLEHLNPKKWHPWMQPFKKADALVAEFDASGRVERVSMLTQVDVAALRNIAPHNQKSFPGFNLDCPLLKTTAPVASWADAIQDIPSMEIAHKVEPEKDKERKKNKKEKKVNPFSRVERLLWDFPLQTIRPKIPDGDFRLAVVSELLKRIEKRNRDPQAFLREIVDAIAAAVQRGELSEARAIDFLFGKFNRQKGKREEWKTPLILEIADMSRFGARIASPDVGNALNEALLNTEVIKDDKIVCALTGKTDEPVGDKMPQPNLKVIGLTYLMAMNKAAPCQSRYGMTAMDIFTIGKSVANSLSDAIQYIAHPLRKNRTWTAVPCAAGDKSDLLIAYIEEAPDDEAPVVGLFGDVDEDASRAVFESRTAEIFRAIRAATRVNQDLHIGLIALNKIDAGRQQIVFSGRYSTEAVWNGRKEWLEGSRNIPVFGIDCWDKKEKRFHRKSPEPPSPIQVMKSFKKQWMWDRKNLAAREVPGIDLGRIYDLLLGGTGSREAERMLERYMKLTMPLLSGIARYLHGDSFKPKDDAKAEALVAVSAIGLLLKKSQRRREEYMEGRDYLLGQFLQYADRLHKLYCEKVRGGQVPPQLIGNAALSMAIQSPNRALEVLTGRLKVYLAWADSYQKEDAGLAKWCRKKLGEIATKLKDHDMKARATVTGKAELLLGYLASEQSEEKSKVEGEK